MSARTREAVYVCDRCGAERVPEDAQFEGDKGFPREWRHLHGIRRDHESLDLCGTCVGFLREWLRAKNH